MFLFINIRERSSREIYVFGLRCALLLLLLLFFEKKNYVRTSAAYVFETRARASFLLILLPCSLLDTFYNHTVDVCMSVERRRTQGGGEKRHGEKFSIECV